MNGFGTIWLEMMEKRKKREAFAFLRCILKVCDSIAVMESSPFVKKFWQFSSALALDSNIIKLFKDCFLHNSSKCKLIDYTNKYVLAGIKPDDLYLYNLCCIFKKEGSECLIITTDEPLIEVLEKEGFKVKHRNEYLETYFEKCYS
jgi:hypothetical protein